MKLSNDLEPAKNVLRNFLKDLEVVRGYRNNVSQPQLSPSFTIDDRMPAFDITKYKFHSDDEEWLRSRGGISAQEGQEILRKVRHFFEQHGEARFTILGESDNNRATINRAGYKKMEQGNWHFFVLPESFKQDVCTGFDVQVAIAILKDRGWLISDSEGKSTRAEKLPCSDSTTRCYRIDGGKVFSDEI